MYNSIYSVYGYCNVTYRHSIPLKYIIICPDLIIIVIYECIICISGGNPLNGAWVECELMVLSPSSPIDWSPGLYLSAEPGAVTRQPAPASFNRRSVPVSALTIMCRHGQGKARARAHPSLKLLQSHGKQRARRRSSTRLTSRVRRESIQIGRAHV